MMWGWLIDAAIIAGLVLALSQSYAIGRTKPRKILRSVLFASGFMLAISLYAIILAVLPTPAGIRRAMDSSRITTQILAHTTGLQSQINHFIEHDVGPRLLTIEPSSDTASIPLDYTINSHKIRPDLEQKMLVLINNERTSRGIPALTMNSGAQAVARAHSQDMFARGYFSHYTPEGLSPFDRLRQGGVGFLSAGENLALAPNLAQAHSGLMNSPGHKANILETQFHTVGIGIIDGGRYGIMVTQDFTN